MPKAIKKGAARQRKERFSNEELIMLSDTLTANAEVVFANDMRRPTLIKKKEIWAEVARKVSAVGSTPRTVKDVRKRWDELCLRVCSIQAANWSLAMGTGGGGGSPIKLQESEETCASTIGVESIEGVGRMERGVPSSSGGGSQSDSEEQDTATQAPPPKKQARGMEAGTMASTLRAKPTKPPMSPRRESPPDVIAAPTPAIPPTHDPPAEGTLSATNSSTGKAAATAPMSDVEDTCITAIEHHTPSPQQSNQPSPRPTSHIDTVQRRHRGHDMAIIRQHQEDITALVGQHVGDAASAREECREHARGIRQAIEACTNRICEEMSLMCKPSSHMQKDFEI
ncbi:myb-related transcription factor, partner of profilin-like [Ambystoma mexicanum]|uniref:myb-related transcription factor, partner of profilin-like n=1 Tax=Ambystoma mexicanum TaxID=8296 RepID=UPI0037E8F69B